jgi:hypothetical protein
MPDDWQRWPRRANLRAEAGTSRAHRESTAGGGLRQCVLGIALAVLGITPAAAQLPDLGAPRGVLRLQIGGDFASANDQFDDGASQPYRAQFSASAVGAAFYPDLAPTQARIASLSGLGSYVLSIGQSTMRAQASVGTLRLGATLGISSKLSVFGMVPIVRQQVSVNYAFDSTGANAGYNPADPVFGTPTGAADVTAFLNEFRVALDSLDTRLTAGYYDTTGNKALAEATLADGTAYLAGLDSLFVVPDAASAFVPLAGSAAGQSMSGEVTATQAALAALSIPSFTQPLPLPTEALTRSDYDQFLTSPAGPIGSAAFSDYTSFLLGDVELGAVYTLIDRWNRPDHPGGLRLAARGLVRLPTGYEPLPNDFVSLPTGGGQTDIQLSLVADVGGGHFGARFEGTYNDQLSGTFLRRITLPSQPIPWRNRSASVQQDPGNEILLSASPYFQLAPGFALTGVVRYWSHGADAVEYASGSPTVPGVSASDLAVDTQRSATIVGGGISYAPTQRGAKVPLDAFWLYEAVVAASGGVVPKAATIRMGLRVPVRLWGNSAE